MNPSDGKAGKEKKIAILSWGSLIWNQGELGYSGDWIKNGPVLPIEFSRISADGRLTLVIDPRNGKKVPTRYAISTFHDLEGAIRNLREREGTTRGNIGFVDVLENTHQSRTTAHRAIMKWAKECDIDAVVWTDLPSKFTDKQFTVLRAIKYLNSLDAQKTDLAREYIHKAPPEVLTPLRKKLNETGWIKEEKK